MIVGCYSLHLYCDREGCDYNSRTGLYQPGDFVAQTYGKACRIARAEGWKIDNKSRKAYCPECSKKSSASR